MSTSSKIILAGCAAIFLLAGARWVFLSHDYQPRRITPIVAPGNVTARSYPLIAPYSGIRWKGQTPEVQYDGNWYELLAIDGISAAEIVRFCHTSYGNLWEKRFDEDLVEVMSNMGHPPGNDVQLRLRSLDTNTTREIAHAAMTLKNRQKIWDSVNKKPVVSEQRFARLSPYSAIRWSQGRPQVFVSSAWYDLIAIDDTQAADIVQFCHDNYGDLWQKRFEEDLVEVLSDMHRVPGSRVKLTLRPLNGNATIVTQADMTADNRRAILLAVQPRGTR